MRSEQESRDVRDDEFVPDPRWVLSGLFARMGKCFADGRQVVLLEITIVPEGNWNSVSLDNDGIRL